MDAPSSQPQRAPQRREMAGSPQPFAARRTGLPREVLLPCERNDALLIISTYGWQSDWIRNLRRHPQVQVTCAGWVLPAQAEIITDLEAKRAIVAAHPFFVPAPFAVLNFLHRTLFRPLWVPVLSWWIRSRPVVLIRSRR
jgi:deazaflavin-dependent oxidoreductase (nitroreductase family)